MVARNILLICLVMLSTVYCKPYHKKQQKHLKAAIDELLKPDPTACGGKPAELFFLLDTSSSIWQVDFYKQLDFVANLVDMFTIGQDNTRVGVATFSNSYHPRFGLTSYDDKEKLKAAILRVPYIGGETMTGTALKYMRLREFRPEIVRPEVAKIAIVLTDGRSWEADVTAKEAFLTKEDGIRVFAIGIGNKFDYSELEKIGSHPSEKYVFEVASYSALDSIKDELMLRTCEDDTVIEEPQAIMQGDLPVCHGDTLADVMFVFDSLAMGAAKTKEIQTFIGKTVEDFQFEDDIMRAGVVSKNCHDGDIQLGDYTDKDEFIKYLRNVDTELSHLVRKLRQHSFTVKQGAREMARRMAVIFVDDHLQVPKRVFSEIEEAKGDDIEIFVVAVGDGVDMKEVEAMATSSTHVLQVPNYDVMGDMPSDLVEMICTGL